MNGRVIVTESYYSLKALARQALMGKWAAAVLGLVVLNLLSNIPAFVIGYIFGESDSLDFIVFVYSILISGPLYFGYGMLTLRLFRGEPTSPIEVMYGFERFGKAFGVYALMVLIVLVCAVVVIIPVALIVGMAIAGGDPETAVALLWLGTLGCMVWAAVVKLRYTFIYFLMQDRPELGIVDTLRTSVRMLSGNKIKLFLLQLSFFGWAFLLLALFVLGIALPSILGIIFMVIGLVGILFLWAYMAQTTAAFYEIASGKMRVNQIAEEEPARQGLANGTSQELQLKQFSKEPVEKLEDTTAWDIAGAVSLEKDSEPAPHTNQDEEPPKIIDEMAENPSAPDLDGEVLAANEKVIAAEGAVKSSEMLDEEPPAPKEGGTQKPELEEDQE